MGVKDECGKRGGRIPCGRWNPFDNRFQDCLDTDAFLGGTFQMAVRIQPQFGIDLLNDPLDISRGQIDFINNRNDHQSGIDSQIGIGNSLGFYALGGIHQ